VAKLHPKPDRSGEPGSKLMYLDNAATTFPKPDCVYEEADTFYRCNGGNAGRGANPLARACAQLLAETREQLAAWLGAPAPERAILTASATQALNLAILGATLLPGDAIYVTPFEHNSVLRPVEHLRQTRGALVRRVPFARQSYVCQLDKLASAFQVEPPAMVCVTQASNVCGVMPPVTEIARLARAANPQVVIIVDGAQTAGLYALPLNESLVDAFIFSGHKALYGPYGVAGLILASDWRPPPLLFGGTGTSSESVQMPSDLPTAYEAGSHNMYAIAGLHAALAWLNDTGREVLLKRTLNLATMLRDALRDLPGVRVLAPPTGTTNTAGTACAAWCGILSFTVEGVAPQAIEAALGAKGIAVRSGLHCAPWAHEWLATNAGGGTVRISVGAFNTTEEVTRFCDHLAHML
jgi:selenocysteine lyase/cysteine desulfurase